MCQGRSAAFAPSPPWRQQVHAGRKRQSFHRAFTVQFLGAAGQSCTLGWKEARERNYFLHDRCGNVLENKGPVWTKRGTSGNIADYKGDRRRKQECCGKQSRSSIPESYRTDTLSSHPWPPLTGSCRLARRAVIWTFPPPDSRAICFVRPRRTDSA